MYKIDTEKYLVGKEHFNWIETVIASVTSTSHQNGHSEVLFNYGLFTVEL